MKPKKHTKQKQPLNRKAKSIETIARLTAESQRLREAIEKLTRNRLGLVAEIQRRDEVIQRLDDFHEIWSVIRCDYWLGKRPE